MNLPASSEPSARVSPGADVDRHREMQPPRSGGGPGDGARGAPPEQRPGGVLRGLWWAGAAAAGLLFALGFGLQIGAAAGSVREGSPWGSGGGLAAALVFALMAVMFLAAGAVISRRRPRNAVGWVLLGIGTAWGLDIALRGFATVAWLQHDRLVTLSQVAVLLDQWTWVPAIGLAGTFMLLLFPDGRLASRRWRPVAWLAAGAMAVSVVAMTFAPGTLTGSGYPAFANPLGVSALPWLGSLVWVGVALIPVCILASAVSLVVRFRRARGAQRPQIKWLATAGAVVAGLYLVTMAASVPFELAARPKPGIVLVLQDISLFSFALVPAAVGIAVLRYRLYDIDRVINQSLVYGSVTVLLGSVYAGLVIGAGALAGRDNALVIAGSTLVVAALFNPLRRRVQKVIDRRFFRGRYDAGLALEAFAAGLRSEVDLHQIRSRLLAVTAETMQPAQAWVWLRDSDLAAETAPTGLSQKRDA